MLTYFSATASEDFWTEHWGGHTVDELLAVATTSPLTTLITDALPRDGVVLEAGCGLGQYVILLRRRGWCAAGVDASLPALQAARRAARVPLAASDLRTLSIRSGAVTAYVSLGVVEHDPDGPDAILAEAHRVLAPGGVLVLSVPYLNGVRRLGARWIHRRQAAIEAAGGRFYQYAFGRRELLAAVRRHGFEPTHVRPYDPARVLRAVLRRTRRSTARRPAPASGARIAPAAAARPSRTWLGRLGRQALYTEPMLRLLGHMLLVVARRP